MRTCGYNIATLLLFVKHLDELFLRSILINQLTESIVSRKIKGKSGESELY